MGGSLYRLPVIGSSSKIVLAICGDCRWTSRVVLQPIRGVRWAEVQERVHVDLIVEDADPAANDQVFSARWLIGEAKAGGEVVLVTRKDVADAIALNLDATRGRNKDRKVLMAAVQRTKVVPAQPPVYVEPASNLEGILREEIEAIDHHFSFRIAHGNRR